jgi:Rod binding domain-containing protein
MDATTLIGQDAYVTGLQRQAAAQAASAQGAKGGKAMDQKKVHDAAQKFESFFVSQMLDHMTAGIETDPMFGGGHGEDTWKSMLNQEYGKEIAKSGRLGITDQVMKGMIKMQEQRDEAAKAAKQAAMPAAPAIAAERDPAGQERAEQDAAVALVAGSRMPVRR